MRRQARVPSNALAKSIAAELKIPGGGSNGTILRQGGRFGGWSLNVKDGQPVYTYNFPGPERFPVAVKDVLPEGRVTVGRDFTCD